MKTKKKIVPEVGLGYYYFDGKVSDSRRFVAEILEVIPFEQAKNLTILTRLHLVYPYVDTIDEWYEVNLLDVWKKEKAECGWIFAEETDYFIKVRIEDYDDDEIWFVRTKSGGWFSMYTTNRWQGGILDVDGEIFNEDDPDINYTRRLS